MKSKTPKAKGAAKRTKRSAGSQQREVSRRHRINKIWNCVRSIEDGLLIARDGVDEYTKPWIQGMFKQLVWLGKQAAANADVSDPRRA